VDVAAGADPRIRNALDRALELGELGIAVAVYIGEEIVVDEWAGRLTERGNIPIGSDTLFPILSVTRAMTTAALHVQAERGLVEYDAPVARYWPEFAQADKQDVTVRQILIEQSGAAAMPQDVTKELLNNWEWVTTRLAEISLLHAPGEANVHHGMNFGWLVGEIVRRTDPRRRLPCQFVKEEIFEPFGIDAWFSLPQTDHHRVAKLTADRTTGTTPSEAPLRDKVVPPSISDIAATFTLDQLQGGCNPTAGALAPARAVARFFAILANGGTLDGKRLLSEERVRSFLMPRPHNTRMDEVAGSPTSRGMGGYGVYDPRLGKRPFLGSSTGALWETGRVAIGYADTDTRVSIAVCRNQVVGQPLKGANPLDIIAAAIHDVLVDHNAA
jgi:CubicO group peptidase (beta-lactamase class C family)